MSNGKPISIYNDFFSPNKEYFYEQYIKYFSIIIYLYPLKILNLYIYKMCNLNVI